MTKRLRGVWIAIACLGSASAAWAGDADLPSSLGEWGHEASKKQDDEKEWRETFSFIRKAPQPGEGNHTRPLLDWDHMEAGLWGGFVSFSGDFESKRSFEPAGSLSLRLPLPAIPFLDRWGVFTQFTVSHIEREIPFYYDHPKDLWWLVAGGADFLLLKNDLMVIRLQGGMTWVQYRDIDGLEDGPGIFGGAYLGFHWVRGDYRFTFGYQPQLAFDGSDMILLNQLGFQFDF
jgi:hypothetical protein